MLAALTTWMPTISAAQSVSVLGDNVGALQVALSLTGRGQLHTIAKDIAWRQAIHGWIYEVGHLPSEANTVADTLSRLSEGPDIPAVLHEAARVEPVDIGRLWRAV